MTLVVATQYCGLISLVSGELIHCVCVSCHISSFCPDHCERYAEIDLLSR